MFARREIGQRNGFAQILRCTWRKVNRSKLEHFDSGCTTRLDEVLYNLAESCRVLAVLLWPYLPGTAGKILGQLNLSAKPDCLADAAWGGLPAGHVCGAPQPLFPRKDLAK